MGTRIAVDIGGTFTDLVMESDAGTRVSKVLSTPEDLVEGVLGAVEEAGVDLEDVSLFIHGTTVGLNTFLERSGGKVALVATRGHRDAYIMLGDLYLHEGITKEADAHFVRAVAIDPDSFAAAYGLGRARFKSGDFAGAVAALRQALARDPDHRDAHYVLGLTYVRQANYRDARAHFARSIALDPDHAESHYGLALILMQQGQRKQARQTLRKVLALAPDHQRARAKLGELDQGP